MDNYPEHLAPEFDKYGAIATPFSEWWARVAYAFPSVPEEVAREWLHRHWSYSPFAFLESRYHTFELEIWKSDNFSKIRWNWNDFKDDHLPAIQHGRYLVEDLGSKHRSWLLDFMLNILLIPFAQVVTISRVSDRRD